VKHPALVNHVRFLAIAGALAAAAIPPAGAKREPQAGAENGPPVGVVWNETLRDGGESVRESACSWGEIIRAEAAPDGSRVLVVTKSGYIATIALEDGRIDRVLRPKRGRFVSAAYLSADEIVAATDSSGAYRLNAVSFAIARNFKRGVSPEGGQPVVFNGRTLVAPLASRLVTFGSRGVRRGDLSTSYESNLVVSDAATLKTIAATSWYQLGEGAVTADGKYLVASTAGRLGVWDGSSGAFIRSLSGDRSRDSNLPFKSVTVDPSGLWAAAGRGDSKCVWRLEDGALIATFEAEGAVAFVPGKNAIVYAEPDEHDAGRSHGKMVLAERDLATGSVRRSQARLDAPPGAIAVSPDGSRIILATPSMPLSAFDRDSGRTIWSIAPDCR
jgi:hypothetical protein